MCRSSGQFVFAALALSLGLLPVCYAQGSEPEQAADRDGRRLPRVDSGGGSPLVVLRLTEDWFTSRIDKEVDELTPVDQVILGTRVRGTARTVGRPRVQLCSAGDRVAMQVVLNGITVSRTVGQNGPAIIRSRSETRFTATKQIEFSPGKGFTAMPVQIAADTRTATEGVQSTRGGLIGRMVERRARQRIEENRPLTTSIARQRAKVRIAAAFDRHMEDLLAQWNRAADLRETIAMLRDGREPRYVCRSNAKFVEIVFGPPQAGPLCTPPALSNLDAPVQVWVHRSLVPAELPLALSRWQSAQADIQSVLERFSNVLPVAYGQPQPRAASQPPAMQYQFIDDWAVLSWQDGRPPISIADRRR